MSPNSRKAPTKKPPVKKLSKVAPSKPSATTNEVLLRLKAQYPDAHCALIHRNPFELLVATILSAQCTDERVNLTTPALFKKYPDAHALARAPIDELEQLVRPTGFYRNKARNLKACAESLVTLHGGRVPQTMDELSALAGVGRKTANVVLGNAYSIPSGVVVDTHVGRLSFRLGWTKSENPVQIERDLIKKFPAEEWIMLSHYLISLGRDLCRARSPRCDRCFLFDACPRRGVK